MALPNFGYFARATFATCGTDALLLWRGDCLTPQIFTSDVDRDPWPWALLSSIGDAGFTRRKLTTHHQHAHKTPAARSSRLRRPTSENSCEPTFRIFLLLNFARYIWVTHFATGGFRARCALHPRHDPKTQQRTPKYANRTPKKRNSGRRKNVARDVEFQGVRAITQRPSTGDTFAFSLNAAILRVARNVRFPHHLLPPCIHIRRGSLSWTYPKTNDPPQSLPSRSSRNMRARSIRTHPR